jgi:hypothetical protein
MTLDELIQQVNSDLGESVAKQAPCADPGELPEALRAFYSQSDGIQFPFVEIYPAQKVLPEFLPGWVCFGFDGYFSYGICRGAAIDLWDHDAGIDPEPYCSDVVQLLVAMYRDEVECSEKHGRVVISALPQDARALDFVPALKIIDDRPSNELLAALRTLPLSIDCRRQVGLRVVRSLQAKGAVCKLHVAV